MSTLVNNAHAYGVIAFTLLAFFLFTRERIPIPVTSLFVIAALALGFYLFPYSGEQGSIGIGIPGSPNPRTSRSPLISATPIGSPGRSGPGAVEPFCPPPPAITGTKPWSRSAA